MRGVLGEVHGICHMETRRGLRRQVQTGGKVKCRSQVEQESQVSKTSDVELARRECSEHTSEGCLRKDPGYMSSLGPCTAETCEFFEKVVVPGVGRQEVAKGRK